MIIRTRTFKLSEPIRFTNLMTLTSTDDPNIFMVSNGQSHQAMMVAVIDDPKKPFKVEKTISDIKPKGEKE